MKTTANLGKVKKRHFWAYASGIVSQSGKALLKQKRKVIILFFILLLAVVGGKDIYSQAQLNLKNYYVFASTESNTLNIETNSTIISENKNSEVLGDETSDTQIESQAILMDKRAYVFDLYFLKNNSPLYGTGKLFVQACDKYGAPRDCIIAVAIARNETNLCKYNISAQMHNCWGFGGSGPNRIYFNSFNDSIDHVTNTLVNGYGVKYIVDPSLMEKVFCGSGPDCSNWGSKIKQFIYEIDNFSKREGFGSLLDLRNN